ncbi:MAG: hypothetical protein FVQ77_07675, partial [Cytophagales bacterium]|nr:hypothetical protein [Cytophagales bacterium]
MISGSKAKIEISGKPARAKVFYRGYYEGASPMVLKVPKKDINKNTNRNKIEIKTAGYETKTVLLKGYFEASPFIVLDVLTGIPLILPGIIALLVDGITYSWLNTSPKKIHYNLKELSSPLAQKTTVAKKETIQSIGGMPVTITFSPKKTNNYNNTDKTKLETIEKISAKEVQKPEKQKPLVVKRKNYQEERKVFSMNEESLPYLVRDSCLIVLKNKQVILCNIYDLKRDLIVFEKENSLHDLLIEDIDWIVPHKKTGGYFYFDKNGKPVYLKKRDDKSKKVMNYKNASVTAILYHYLGKQIDKNERDYYWLFPGIDGFISAKFIEKNLYEYFFKIKFKPQHVVKDTIIYISYSRLELIKKHFTTFETIINKKRKV